MKCRLICFSCKESFEYNISENFCFNCGEEIVEDGIKELVFIFNLIEIKTERSCQGHYDFDNGYREGFPWIVFIKDSDISEVAKIIEAYNHQNSIYSNWKVKWNQEIRKHYICPTEEYRSIEFLRKGGADLSKFIFKQKKIKYLMKFVK